MKIAYIAYKEKFCWFWFWVLCMHKKDKIQNQIFNKLYKLSIFTQKFFWKEHLFKLFVLIWKEKSLAIDIWFCVFSNHLFCKKHRPLNKHPPKRLKNWISAGAWKKFLFSVSKLLNKLFIMHKKRKSAWKRFIYF